MKILCVNAGSSSLKFQMFKMPEEDVLISGIFERIAMENSNYTIKISDKKYTKTTVLKSHEDAVEFLVQELLENNIISSLAEINGIGHRVVHGGTKYDKSVLINNEVIKDVEAFYDLAPLHNPPIVSAIKAFEKVLPNVPTVAVFDTAFHQTLEPKDYLYPVPYTWYEKYNVRKYGFHGTSHKYIFERIADILGKKDIKVISCHLGNGSSIAAIKNGKCIDTSMGFTPLAGIMMGTRCGDIDSSIIPYIMQKEKLTVEEVNDILNKKSGFLGISGFSHDSRDIEDACEIGNDRAILTRQMAVKSIVNYIARYYIELDGVDAICFTAGIGENSSDTRKSVMEKLRVLGIQIDEEANKARSKEIKITSENSKIACYIIPTNEELMIVKDTYNLIK